MSETVDHAAPSYVDRVRRELDLTGARYEVIDHARAYTAQETAAAAHVPGDSFAKSVVAIVDGEPRHFILPAPAIVDFDAIRDRFRARSLSLASEEALQELFAEAEVGAMAPLPSLHGVPVYAERHLLANKEIVFAAGSHTQAVRMEVGDYLRVASPEVFDFTHEAGEATRAVDESRRIGWLALVLWIAGGAAALMVVRSLLRNRGGRMFLAGLGAGAAVDVMLSFRQEGRSTEAQARGKRYVRGARGRGRARINRMSQRIGDGSHPIIARSRSLVREGSREPGDGHQHAGTSTSS